MGEQLTIQNEIFWQHRDMAEQINNLVVRVEDLVYCTDSIKSQVLRKLRSRGPEGICLVDFDKEIVYTFRNRISELRQEGFKIESERCRMHNHRSSVSRYYLDG